jgi:hypothetical protein
MGPPAWKSYLYVAVSHIARLEKLLADIWILAQLNLQRLLHRPHPC